MTDKVEIIDKETAMKKAKLKRTILFSAILLIVMIIAAGTQLFRSNDTDQKEYRYLSLFSEVASLVKNEYVEKVNPKEKIPGAFTGMLSSLDKYSAYLDKQKTGIYNLYKQNKAFNCGIYGMKTANYFYIADVVKNSSADIAGIKPGSIIRAIDGKSIFGQPFWQMYLSLLSDKPREIHLLLYKDNPDSPQEIKLSTLPPTDNPVFKKLRPDVFLIELSRIDKEHVYALKNHLEHDLPGPGPVKLIIDLRKYEGGELEPFIELTRLLFNRAIPLTLKLKDSTQTISLGSEKALNYRAVILIDKSTMMYGELLAEMFEMYREKDKITLAGSKTRGFMSKLMHIPLDDGSSILLTEGFFLFNGINPAKTGVKPDVVIKEENAGSIIDYCISNLLIRRERVQKRQTFHFLYESPVSSELMLGVQPLLDKSNADGQNPEKK
jgi:carboxyl-terminal processing protease